MNPIIQAIELLALRQNTDLVLVDASNSKNAKTNFEKEHLEGSLFVDLNTQLADIKANTAEGGRHPLPSFSQFSKTLSDLGISPKSHVVIYDDKNASNAAARFWWLLKAIGHEKVQVLNGGIQEAIKAGFPKSAKISIPKSVEPYPITEWKLPIADISEVEKATQDRDYIIVDVRDSERYRGEVEPIDSIAGHIPEAINIPFVTNLDKNGLFLNPSELKNKYLEAFEDKKISHIIVHCGSGVTACHTLLALEYAGLPMPKLYVGSWSEWSKNNKPIIPKPL